VLSFKLQWISLKKALIWNEALSDNGAYAGNWEGVPLKGLPENFLIIAEK
jgi:hypothetical protein